MKEYSPKRRTAARVHRQRHRGRLPRRGDEGPRRVRGQARPRGGLGSGHGGGLPGRGDGRGQALRPGRLLGCGVLRVALSPAARGGDRRGPPRRRLRRLPAAHRPRPPGRPPLPPGPHRRPRRARARPARLLAKAWAVPDALAGPYLATLAIPIFALSILAVAFVAPGLAPGPAPLRGGLRVDPRGAARRASACGARFGRPRAGPPWERSRRRKAMLGERYVGPARREPGPAGLPRADPARRQPRDRPGASLRRARGGPPQGVPGRPDPRGRAGGPEGQPGAVDLRAPGLRGAPLRRGRRRASCPPRRDRCVAWPSRAEGSTRARPTGVTESTPPGRLRHLGGGGRRRRAGHRGVRHCPRRRRSRPGGGAPGPASTAPWPPSSGPRWTASWPRPSA